MSVSLQLNILTNNCLCAVLSSLAFITPPPPLCLSFPGVADLSLIYKLNNSSFVGVKLCVYAYVCPCQRSPRGSWVRGVNSSFLEVKMQLRQIYCLCSKGAPRILGISHKSAPCPPIFSLLILTVHTSSPHCLDRRDRCFSSRVMTGRESCVTPPHRTINQADWEAHPKPCGPHATQTDYPLDFFKWAHLGPGIDPQTCVRQTNQCSPESI